MLSMSSKKFLNQNKIAVLGINRRQEVAKTANIAQPQASRSWETNHNCKIVRIKM